MSAVAFEYASTPGRPHTKRGRHSSAFSPPDTSLPHSPPLDYSLYSPSTSPPSHYRHVSGRSSSSSSSASPHSASPQSYAGPQHSPAPSLKRLCVNSTDGHSESVDDDSQQPMRSPRQQLHLRLQPSHLQLQSHPNTANRVLVRAKRQMAGSTSASVTPSPSQPNSRPSTAASTSLRASFNLSEPATDDSSMPPANSAPTSSPASPHMSTASSPLTRYNSILSSSVPSGSQSFLSLLNVSCASANSSFPSPVHSPAAGCFQSSSQHGTPSSAHSSVTFRPHIMSAQERAALFPSRSVSSSPLPPDAISVYSNKRTSNGKRAGENALLHASAAIDVSRRSSEGERDSKRVKDDRRRDRRRSIVSSYSEQRDVLLLGDAGDECDDMLLQLSLVPGATPMHTASRLSLVVGSCNSLSSLDSPSSTSYPRMSAPLNSPVSGSHGRRAGHIAADHLLGTAAAAASVARRRNSVYEEDEQGLVDAVGAMQLCSDGGANKGEEEEKEGEETSLKLPAAPRLASRTTSLRLDLTANSSRFPTDNDSEQACDDADDDSVVLSSSPMPSRQQSSPGDYYETFIPSTGSFSKVLRAQRQISLFGSNSSSGSSSSSSPFPPSPVLSPMSPTRPLHHGSFMSHGGTAIVLAPLSPSAFPSDSASSSFSTLSTSLSDALSSSFTTGPPLSLSPFAALPDFPPAFSRSASHTVDPNRLAFGGGGGGVGGGQHTSGGLDKRHMRAMGLSERERTGDGVGLDVPFLKELSLPPRGPGRRSAMN